MAAQQVPLQKITQWLEQAGYTVQEIGAPGLPQMRQLILSIGTKGIGFMYSDGSFSMVDGEEKHRDRISLYMNFCKKYSRLPSDAGDYMLAYYSTSDQLRVRFDMERSCPVYIIKTRGEQGWTEQRALYDESQALRSFCLVSGLWTDQKPADKKSFRTHIEDRLIEKWLSRRKEKSEDVRQ